MATSESNLAAISSASQLLTRTSNSQSMNIAEQAISGLTNLGESFSSIFTGAQQASETLNQLSPSNIDNETDSINTIQQSIFSSLGLGSLSNETGLSTLDLLTSQSSIEFMQASLLSALQTSVFSAKTEISNTTSEIDTTIDSNSLTAEGSIINSLAQLSFGEDGLDSNDAFDIVNILQHIPVVSAFYQDVTGQEDISMISKLSGGYLYGGPIGLAYSALDLAIKSYSGTSINEAMLDFNYASLFSGEDDAQELQTTNQTSVKQFNFLNQK